MDESHAAWQHWKAVVRRYCIEVWHPNGSNADKPDFHISSECRGYFTRTGHRYLSRQYECGLSLPTLPTKGPKP
ncbi:MAG: hypothetical protein AAED33_02035, partial [Paracoccaceae bacterium]